MTTMMMTGAVIGWGQDAPMASAPPVTKHARVLFVHEGDVNLIHCRPLMECSIEAPKGEQFVSVMEGDPERWPDSKTSLPSRFYSIKPNYAGLKTDIHLRTDHDNEYGFLVDLQGEMDYTVILKTEDPEVLSRIAAPSTVVPRAELELAQRQSEQALKELAAVKQETSQKVQQAQTQATKTLVAEMRSYEFDRKKAADRPWMITEIQADDHFAYIKRSAKGYDLPSVYGIGENGKPEVIVPHYDPDRDLYVIPQRIVRGYLTFGGEKHEKRLMFSLPAGA